MILHLSASVSSVAGDLTYDDILCSDGTKALANDHVKQSAQKMKSEKRENKHTCCLFALSVNSRHFLTLSAGGGGKSGATEKKHQEGKRERKKEKSWYDPTRNSTSETVWSDDLAKWTQINRLGWMNANPRDCYYSPILMGEIQLRWQNFGGRSGSDGSGRWYFAQDIPSFDALQVREKW